MQNHREVVCVAQVGDFFRGGDAADPIDIELNDIDRLGPAFGATWNGQPAVDIWGAERRPAGGLLLLRARLRLAGRRPRPANHKARGLTVKSMQLSGWAWLVNQPALHVSPWMNFPARRTGECQRPCWQRRKAPGVGFDPRRNVLTRRRARNPDNAYHDKLHL